MSDDQLHKQASCQTVKDDMWIDKAPLKALHCLRPVCSSVAQMCEYREEQSVCAHTCVSVSSTSLSSAL